MKTLNKLSYQFGNEWIPHSYPPVFAIETTSDQSKRLIVGIPGGDVTVPLHLIECLNPPFRILYILHTPRGEGDSGRYQSPEVGQAELQKFFSKFAIYLGGDARFDIWVHSPSTNGTLVWDRHNLIYGYGPLKCFTQTLRRLGFSENTPTIPKPHMHHYREELDADARALLLAFSWQRSPLRPEDDQ